MKFTSNLFGDSDYFKNPTTLFKLIEQRRWTDVTKYLETHKDDTKLWVTKRDKDCGSVTWRRLPLHEACIRRAPEEVLCSLIEACREAAKCADTYGRLPIHHVCVHGASEFTVHQLLLAFPDSIDVQDVWGKTPLAAAQATMYGNKNKVLELLQRKPSYYAVKVVEQKQKQAEDKIREEFEITLQVKEEEFKRRQESTRKEIQVVRKQMADLVKRNTDVQNHYDNASIKVAELEKKLEGKYKKVSELIESHSKVTAVLEEQTEKHRELIDYHSETCSKLNEVEKVINVFAEKCSASMNCEPSETLMECINIVETNEDSLNNKIDGYIEIEGKLNQKIKMLDDLNSELQAENVEKRLLDQKEDFEGLMLGQGKIINDHVSSIKTLEEELHKAKQDNLSSMKTLEEELHKAKQDNQKFLKEKEEFKSLLKDKDSSVHLITEENNSLKNSMFEIDARTCSLQEKVDYFKSYFEQLDKNFSNVLEGQDELLFTASSLNIEDSSSFFSDKVISKEQSERVKLVSAENHKILNAMCQQKAILKCIRQQKMALKESTAKTEKNIEAVLAS